MLVISTGESCFDVGSCFIICLSGFEASCLSFNFLLAIMAFQKFMSKKITDSILRTFNIFNIKINK